MSKRRKVALGITLGVVVLLLGTFVFNIGRVAGFDVLADFLLPSAVGQGGAIRVHVKYVEPGDPVVGVRVWLSKVMQNGDLITVKEGKTDDLGEYLFRNVPYSSLPKYRVTAGPDGNQTIRETGDFELIRGADDPVKDVEIMFPPREGVPENTRIMVYGNVYDEHNNELEGGEFYVYIGNHCQGDSYDQRASVVIDGYGLPGGDQRYGYLAANLNVKDDQGNVQPYCFKFDGFAGYETKQIIKNFEPTPQYQRIDIHLGSIAKEFTLKGRITDSNTRGLLDQAMIEVRREKEGQVLFRTTSSDSPIPGDVNNSNFKIENIPTLRTDNQYVESYHLTVIKNNFMNGYRVLFDHDIEQPETIRDFELYQEEGEEEYALIKGQVRILTNSGEEPAVDERVIFQEKERLEIFGVENLGTTRTDSNGNYSFTVGEQSGLNWNKKKRVRCLVERDGRSYDGFYLREDPHWFEVKRGDSITGADVLVDVRVSGIVGTVLKAENSQPLEGASVKVRPRWFGPADEAPGSGSIRGSAKTNQQGIYQIDNLKPELWYEVTASYQTDNEDERRSQVTRYLFVPKKQRVKADFRLALNEDCLHMGSISGYVFDSEANPISGATVTLNNASLWERITGRATVASIRTNQEGKFYFPLDDPDIERGDLLWVIVSGEKIKTDRNAKHRFRVAECGMVYRVDFFIDPPDQGERWPWRKDVILKVQRRWIDWDSSYLKRSDGQERIDNFPGVRVQLVADVGGDAASSSYSYLTDIKTTDSKGEASFNDIPTGFEYKVVIYEPIIIKGAERSYRVADPNDLIIQPPERGRQRVLLDIEPLWKPIGDKSLWPRIYRHQCDSRWGHIGIRGIGSMCGSGCCVASITMALQYYYPDKEITPLDWKRSGINGRLGPVERVQSFVSFIEGGRSYRDCRVKVYKVSSWEAVRRAVNKGFPVVAHMNAGGWPGHSGAHCMLIVRASPDHNRKFFVLDSFPHKGDSRYREVIARYASPKHAYVFEPRDASLFTFGVSNNKQQISPKAVDDEIFAFINQNEKLRVYAQIEEHSGNHAGRVVIETDNNGESHEYRMRQREGLWHQSIPGFRNQSDFRFRIKVYSEALTAHTSDWHQVRVQDDSSYRSRVQGAYSELIFSLHHSGPYQAGLALIESYNNWLYQARKNFLERVGQGDIHGFVRIMETGEESSGRPLAGALLRVGDSVAVTDDDGYYRINNLPAHRPQRVIIQHPETRQRVRFAADASANDPRETRVDVEEGVLVERHFWIWED